jgi:hypothetical protein
LPLVSSYFTVSLTDAIRQILQKPAIAHTPEFLMIVAAQTQEFVLDSTRFVEQVSVVHDEELLYVGGGSSGCVLM